MRALRVNLFMPLLALSMIAAQSVTAQVAYSYAELKPLLDAESHNEKEKVITLADEIVRRSNDSLGNQARAFAIKGIAYQMRAKAFVELGRGEPNNIIRDLMRAADFGNLNASKALAAVFLNLRAKGSKVLENAREESVAFEHYIRMAAELGDLRAIQAITQDALPSVISIEEKVYWQLHGVLLDPNNPPENKRRYVAVLNGLFSGPEFSEIFDRYSPVRILPPSKSMPGRGIIATLLVDAALRSIYAQMGDAFDKERADAEGPKDIMQIFAAARVADRVGWTSTFLLVPGPKRFTDQAIISMPSNSLSEALNAGDIVVLRCGAVAHSAAIWRIDLKNDAVYFADSFYEFWEDSVNLCLSSFELVPSSHGRFLSRVSLGEIVPIIQAVQTTRDKL